MESFVIVKFILMATFYDDFQEESEKQLRWVFDNNLERIFHNSTLRVLIIAWQFSIKMQWIMDTLRGDSNKYPDV